MFQNEFGEIEITSNFECGSGLIKNIAENVFFIQIQSDPPIPITSIDFTGGYDWYFCVKILNMKTQTTIIDLIFNKKPLNSLDNDWFPTNIPFFYSYDSLKWHRLLEAKIGSNGSFFLRLSLEPGNLMYVSNSIPFKYGDMNFWLRTVQAKNERLCYLHSIGKTVQGRDIYMITITDPDVKEEDKDRVLITSGLHPAEPDWLATTAIIEYLTGDSDWSKDIRRKYITDIITQANPDGTVLGTNGCNANGINLYWDFRPYDREQSPEAYYLWNWIENHPPIIYIDFHCYTVQIHKDYSPYIKPLFFYDSRKLRKIVKRIDTALISLSNGRYMGGYLTSIPNTLNVQITEKFSTIAYTKYHLHLKHGEDNCKALGLAVWKTILEIADEFRPLKVFLRKPYGKSKRSCLMGFVRKVYYAQKNSGPLRKVLKFVYRIFTKINSIK